MTKLLVAIFGAALLTGPAMAGGFALMNTIGNLLGGFGGQYAIGSDLLDICFKQNGPKLSKPCVDALIAAGDTSQEYVDQQKRLLGK